MTDLSNALFDVIQAADDAHITYIDEDHGLVEGMLTGEVDRLITDASPWELTVRQKRAHEFEIDALNAADLSDDRLNDFDGEIRA